jgi:hypothetical protein
VAEAEAAGLGCDMQAHGLGDGETVAAFERRPVEEIGDAGLQQGAGLGREPRHERDLRGEEGSLSLGKGRRRPAAEKA